MNYKKLVLIGSFLTIGASSSYVPDKNRYEQEIVKHSYLDVEHEGTVIAHRGFSSIEVENSLSAIEKGLDLRCSDGIEIDVRITKDNEIVLTHDDNIDALGKIEECYCEDLQKVENRINEIEKLQKIKNSFNKKDGKLVYDRYNMLCKKEEKIITLDDVLKYDESKILIIDLKFDDDNYQELYTKINEKLKNYNGDFKIILQSDNYDSLEEMKELYPDYYYQLIIKKRKDLENLDSDFDAFCIRKNLITKKIVHKLEEKEKDISIWTINSYDDYAILRTRLDDYIKNVNIITDYPDEICYLINHQKIKKKNK